MELAPLIEQYLPALKAKYGHRLLPGQRQAIAAMRRCRTPASGQMLLCCHHCDTRVWKPHSCGHRSCPKCQHYEASQWLERQQAKLLPVEYFMSTFTLPYELRELAWQHQSAIYNALFAAARSTLKDFGLNPKHLGAEIGMTSVLHTHSRRLDYHPHLHVIIPGGGVNKSRKQWKKKKEKYLFNAFAVAKVFRARLLAGIAAAGLTIPKAIPGKWVVNIKHVGRGLPALKYLSRYLYRGVISEKQILRNHNGMVTFQYIESATGQTNTRTLKGEDLLWMVLHHVLPKGLRRVRDYGFLHGNAKKLLRLVQLILQVMIEASAPLTRPTFLCRRCQRPMQITAFVKHGPSPG